VATDTLILTQAQAPPSPMAPRGLLALALRNLWRQRSRTLYTISGIVFTMLLLVFVYGIQVGTFNLTLDGTAKLWVGHLQIQHEDYFDDPVLENTISNVSAVLERVRAQPGVSAVAARATAFGLMSRDEISVAVGLVGTSSDEWGGLTKSVTEGRYLAGPGELVLGARLAQNLNAKVGDELVVLGTDRLGGVAAFAGNLVGIVETGIPAMDRSVAHIGLADLSEVWGLHDEAHEVAILADDPGSADDLAQNLTRPGERVLTWAELLPEISQMKTLKEGGTLVMVGVIGLIVIFSVVNTFMMVIFERTPEFGMMKALGMRPMTLVKLVMLEALCLSSIGAVAGFAISGSLVAILGVTGIPLPAELMEGMSQMMGADLKIMPVMDWGVAIGGSVILVLGIGLGALIPTLKLKKLAPVEALRRVA